MENHHFFWVNPLFQWPFSIAFCKRLPGRVTRMYLRVDPMAFPQRQPVRWSEPTDLAHHLGQSPGRWRGGALAMAKIQIMVTHGYYGN